MENETMYEVHVGSLKIRMGLDKIECHLIYLGSEQRFNTAKRFLERELFVNHIDILKKVKDRKLVSNNRFLTSTNPN